jgi:hypothetical protein
MSETKYVYCAYPSAFVYEKPDLKSAKKKHLFWGDTIKFLDQESNDFLKVYSRDETGWIKKNDTLVDPILDIIFLDVGQGDSCIIVTPKDEKIIVDTGKGNNLLRYLKWRYKSFSTPEMQEMAAKIKSIIITHGDNDHYGGLDFLFKDAALQNILNVDSIYHNGLFPRKGSGAGSLGTKKKIGSDTYITDLIFDDNDLTKFLNNTSLWQNLDYPTLINSIKQSHPSIIFQMLNHQWSGTPQLTTCGDLTFSILGPYVETDGGKIMLSYFGDPGLTKNGHSVLVFLKYGDIRIFLSGDLNTRAEDYLLKQYRVDGVFQAEVLKIAHHGSSSFSDDFLAAVGPFVSVISSGDSEPYSHPRADTLGLIGKVSRGRRPLIFSTELARSTPEYFKRFSNLNKNIIKLEKAASAPEIKKAEKNKIESELDKMNETTLNRAVAVYGAINLRTDGRRLLMSQKLEKKNTKNEEWDIYLLEPDPLTQQMRLVDY